MVNVEAKKYVDEKYPINDVCQRKSDSENKNKKRKDIITLDLSQGKLGKHFWEKEGNTVLFGSLKMEGFTNLRKLIISSHQLINLDVSECSKLEELDCSGNQLDNLNVIGCENLKIINCSRNNIRKLDLHNCPKLEEVDISNCSNLTENGIKTNFSYNNNKGKLTRINSQVTPVEENDIRNVLVIGITGNGKSALANTLAGTSVANKFEEKSSTTSVTKNFRQSEFTWEKDDKKVRYRVIDNIGFGDTNNITEEIILQEIGKGIYAAKEGINQVLFVFRGRFSPEHVVAFNMFKNYINESGITKFTTIIRTNFESFRNSKRCAEDKESLLAQNQELRKLIESCNNVIYVDNPSVPVIEDEDSEGERERKRTHKFESEKIREKSRKIVLDYLIENCQGAYKLEGWDDIALKVEKYIKRKEEIEKSDIPNKEQSLKKEWNEVSKGIKVSLEANVPGLPVGLKAMVEYNTHMKK